MPKWYETCCARCGYRERRYHTARHCSMVTCRGRLERLRDAAAPAGKARPTWETLRAALLRCAAHAGHPDPAEGCRLVVRAVKEALAGEG